MDNKDSDKNQPISNDAQKEDLTSSTNSRQKIMSYANDILPRLLAVSFGVLYLMGFLVVNAHLNRYGVFEIEIANARYVLAGAVFIFFLVAFYLFGGRAIIFGKKWLTEDIFILQKSKSGADKKWEFIAFVYSLVHTLFFVCLSAALFSSIAFGFTETFFFYVAGTIPFLINYSMDISNYDLRYPKIHIILKLLSEILMIIIFFALAESWKPIMVFVLYFGAMFYINFVLDHFERYHLTTDRVVFSFIYGCVFFLTTAISFGALIYGDVTRKIGGGQFLEGHISLKEEPTINDKTLLSKDREIKIIYMTDKHLFVEIENKTIRIPEEAVNSIEINRPSLSAVSDLKVPWLKGGSTPPSPQKTAQ